MARIEDLTGKQATCAIERFAPSCAFHEILGLWRISSQMPT
jgi:hypothetical protein